jgi:hypothetical protein
MGSARHSCARTSPLCLNKMSPDHGRDAKSLAASARNTSPTACRSRRASAAWASKDRPVSAGTPGPGPRAGAIESEAWCQSYQAGRPTASAVQFFAVGSIAGGPLGRAERHRRRCLRADRLS